MTSHHANTVNRLFGLAAVLVALWAYLARCLAYTGAEIDVVGGLISASPLLGGLAYAFRMVTLATRVRPTGSRRSIVTVFEGLLWFLTATFLLFIRPDTLMMLTSSIAGVVVVVVGLVESRWLQRG